MIFQNATIFLLALPLIAAISFRSVVAIGEPGPSAEPTCDSHDTDEPTCESVAPVCRLWFDGEFVYIGGDKPLRWGDVVGEPDVVVEWHNHDPQAWMTWHRFSQFYQGNDKHKHVFAPAYMTPHQCHSHLSNLVAANPAMMTLQHQQFTAATNQSLPLKANRALRKGDVVFTNCRHSDLSSDLKLDQLPKYKPGYFEEACTCLDVIEPRPSTLEDAGLGAYSRYSVRQGHPIAFAQALHLRRSELHNVTSGQHELLLNYAFGHAQTQLLLLPVAAGVNYINHGSAKKANVKLAWSLHEADSIENHFGEDPSHVMFARSERPHYFLRYDASRDIAAGEELFMDYGNAWEQAWNQHVKLCGGSVTHCNISFRHEIGVPNRFFPQRWLDRETETVPRHSWDTPPLRPGQVRQLQVFETGQRPMLFGHRIGLPPQFAILMKEYADRMGITAIMERYIHDQPLPIDGTERHTINGGTWWAKRFDGDWESNMHYITPDDERSNTDFLSALGEAGFDQVLGGMGEYFQLDGLICYYPSFIAVSHCTGSYPHTDAEDTNGKGFNLIFPIQQATNDSLPELMLGEDGFGPLVVPYRYEPEAAVVLGDDGVHHTAPCNYDDRQMRMVISVYMADINDDNQWQVYWDDSMDPPYPPAKSRMHYLMSNAGRDWKAGVPQKKLPVRDESFA